MREEGFAFSKSLVCSRHFVLVCVGLAAVVLLSSFSAGAQTPIVFESQKLFVPGGDYPRAFGHSVDVSGEVTVIGGAFDADNGFYSGSVYIYRYDGTRWVEEQRLLASDGAVRDYFGWAVAISGNTAVIGSFGSAYVYRYDGTRWVEEQKLLAFGGAAGGFGLSVAVSGNTTVIGGSGYGSAYVYRYNGTRWVEEQNLLPSDGAMGNGFDTDVSVSGDVVVSGIAFGADNGFDSGSAYVYRYNGIRWVEEQKLLASDGAAGDRFGFAVDISEDVVVIGAAWDDDSVDSSGSAYVYRYDGIRWVEEQKLLASDGSMVGLFGWSVAVFGSVAVIGAPRDTDNGPFSGSAYIYRDYGGGWVEEQKLLASGGAAFDNFGNSVAISGKTAVIGAPTITGFDESNAAYVYALVMDTPVDIDIKPGSDLNSIYPSLEGSLPVAIFGSNSFDVADVDVTTLAFGPSGASIQHRRGPHFRDLDRDGFGDLLAHFRIEETGIAFGDRIACITGEKLDATPFKGCDAVRTVPGTDGDSRLDVEEASSESMP